MTYLQFNLLFLLIYVKATKHVTNMKWICGKDITRKHTGYNQRAFNSWSIIFLASRNFILYCFSVLCLHSKIIQKEHDFIITSTILVLVFLYENRMQEKL